MGKLTHAASDLDSLFRAWRDVRLQTRHSSWPSILQKREAIEAAPIRELSAIQTQLWTGCRDNARAVEAIAQALARTSESSRGVAMELSNRFADPAFGDLVANRVARLAQEREAARSELDWSAANRFDRFPGPK